MKSIKIFLAQTVATMDFDHRLCGYHYFNIQASFFCKKKVREVINKSLWLSDN